jgi:hypothetical protein
MAKSHMMSLKECGEPTMALSGLMQTSVGPGASGRVASDRSNTCRTYTENMIGSNTKRKVNFFR